MVSEGCCPNSAPRLDCFHVELTLAREGVANQFPFDQIETVVNGSAGEILESRSGTEVIFADSNDGRIRVESLDDRVLYHGHLSDERSAQELISHFGRALSFSIGSARCQSVEPYGVSGISTFPNRQLQVRRSALPCELKGHSGVTHISVLVSTNFFNTVVSSIILKAA